MAFQFNNTGGKAILKYEFDEVRKMAVLTENNSLCIETIQ